MTAETFQEMAFAGKLAASFGAGFMSFISPCVLPLVPSYISFITGISFEELTDDVGAKKMRRVVLVNSLMFVLGFSAVFILILGFSAQIFGQYFIEYKDIIRRIGGVVIFLLGLHVIGVINFAILQRDKRLHSIMEKPQGLLGSFLIGVGFAAGWTPCIGPILSAVFAVAATSPNPMVGFALFTAYSLGLAIPFLLTALGINTFLRHYHKAKKHLRSVSIVTGIILIVTGILIFFNSFAIITRYMNMILPGIG